MAGLHSRPDHRHWRGALFALLASLLFSTQDALIKWLSDNYTLLQLLLIRSALSVPLMFLAVRAPIWLARIDYHEAGGAHTARVL